jgi:hypothetical protein
MSKRVTRERLVVELEAALSKWVVTLSRFTLALQRMSHLLASGKHIWVLTGQA